MVETKILPELIDDLKDELSIEEIERIRQSLEEKENQLIEAIDQTETVEGADPLLIRSGQHD